MQNPVDISLTSAEIAALWAEYMNNTLAACVLSHFMEVAKDEDVKPVLASALTLSQKIAFEVRGVFARDNIAVPVGFSSQDVFKGAPRLYSDSFALFYIKQMARIGMSAYATALPFTTRPDLRSMFFQFNTNSMELDEQVTSTLLNKGIFVKAPHIPVPRNVEFAQDPGFLGSLLGEKRTLHAVEVTHLFANLMTNSLGKALIIGFAQVASAPEIRDFFLRGMGIAKKNIDVLSNLLRADDLPAPITWDAEISDSRQAPFTDKLMMFHTAALTAASFGFYGLGMAASSRSDLVTLYGRLMAENADYAKEAANIMIKHNWLEAPPKAADRKELATVR